MAWDRSWQAFVGGDSEFLHSAESLFSAASSFLPSEQPGGQMIDEATLLSLQLGRYHDARAIISKYCTTERWWCAALTGLSYFLERDLGSADSAFDESIGNMSRETLCDWNNIGAVLGDTVVSRTEIDGATTTTYYDNTFTDEAVQYSRLSCDGRTARNDTIWWLGDPLWSDRGSELRSAHLSRRVLGELLRREVVAIGSDPRAVDDAIADLVRTGVATVCLRRSGSDCVFGYKWVVEGGPRYEFGRGAAAVAKPFAIRAGDAVLLPRPFQQMSGYSRSSSRRVAGRTRTTRDVVRQGSFAWYVSRYGEYFHVPHVQMSYMGLGDSSRILVSFVADSLAPTGMPAQMASVVTLSLGPGTFHRSSRFGFDGATTARLQLSAPSESSMVSIEAYGPDLGVHMARFANGPEHDRLQQRVNVSDLVVYDAHGDVLPSSTEGALAAMRPSTDISRQDSIGVYWELYGLTADELVGLEISVVSVSRGSGNPLSALLGLFRKKSQVKLRWTQPSQMRPVPTQPCCSYAVNLDLAALSAGDYWLQLTANVDGQMPVRAWRSVTIRQR